MVMLACVAGGKRAAKPRKEWGRGNEKYYFRGFAACSRALPPTITAGNAG